MRNTKGQVTLTTVIIGFIAIVIYSALLPAISSMIDNVVPYLSGTYPMALFVVKLFPLIIILAIIMKVFNHGNTSG